jgi:hypothetical protein|tara:strand:+ start:269 stop:532 length:264 start_codon:yes stop_codon:yes gene_type:complete
MRKKQYNVLLSPKEIELLRDCIDFQFQMSGYDDPLNWEQIAEDKQTIDKLINMDNKLNDIIPLKDYFPNVFGIVIEKPKQLEFNFND